MSIGHEYTLTERSEVARLLPGQYATVLEIGCAKGGFKANLQEGCELWGVEPFERAASEAASRGYKVLVGTYDVVRDQCPDDYFDLVICNDVIEHMADHDAFLADIRKKMKKNGRLVGSIPNVRHFGNLFKLLFRKDWKYEDYGVLDRTHLRFFTEKSLARTFLDHGYAIEELRGINGELDRPATIRQWLKNMALLLVMLLSFGSFRDVQYMQFGFRLRPSPQQG